MKVLKQISICILLLIIVFSSVGVSFYLHNCHCHKTIYISLGTAFNTPKPSVCGTCCTTVSGKQNNDFSIGKKGCCQDYVVFYLLPVAPDKAPPQITLTALIQLFSPIALLIQKAEISLNRTTIPHFISPPPLLSGRNLVYFIQQIKIPFLA